MKRCDWVNLANPLYVDYHDNERARDNFEDDYLYEVLILECFQAGLSRETVLNKREAFRKAYDNFDIEKVSRYDSEKINSLIYNEDIIRHKKKIIASVENSEVFKKIQKEYGSFYKYIRSYTGYEPIYELGKSNSPLSKEISKDLKKRGMKFTGPTVVYSFLQATGFIKSHQKDCFLYKKL